MSATAEVIESNGTSAAKVDTVITSLPMGSVDAHDLVPADHPITAGQNSFEKWLRVHITDIGSAAILDNFKAFFSSLGAWKTGEKVKTNCSSIESKYSAASYPTGGPVATASTIALYDMPEAEPAQSNLGIGGLLHGQVIPASIPAYTDYVCLQLQTTVSTPSGEVNPKVLVIQWDER